MLGQIAIISGIVLAGAQNSNYNNGYNNGNNVPGYSQPGGNQPYGYNYVPVPTPSPYTPYTTSQSSRWTTRTSTPPITLTSTPPITFTFTPPNTQTFTPPNTQTFTPRVLEATWTTPTTRPWNTPTTTPWNTPTTTPWPVYSSNRLYSDSAQEKAVVKESMALPAKGVLMSSWVLPLGVVAATLAGFAAVAVIAKLRLSTARPTQETQPLTEQGGNLFEPAESSLLEEGMQEA